MDQPTLYERITAARTLLGLKEEATLEEIETRVKILVKRWHPDTCQEEQELCAEMTRQILTATELIRSYCNHYRYSFRPEEVEKYISPEEWWHKRFGGDPYWAKERAIQDEWYGGKRRSVGKKP
ncbi:MAG: J domain-containing protein [Magnetococcales bacterium]|nr:J domain-containing protein [Magnetococcales bacterium]